MSGALKMTDDEKEIVLMLNDLYERYIALPEQHSKDKEEFVNALHVIQHLVMVRSVRRRYPEMFPINLKVDAKIDDINDMSPIERAISETLSNALKNEGKVK